MNAQWTSGKVSPASERLQTIERDLSPNARKIFYHLARNFGLQVSGQELVEVLYHDREDGGPEWSETVVAVTINRYRHLLAPLALRIEGKGGPNGGRRLVWQT